MTTQRELPIALRAAYLAFHRLSETAFAPYDVTADQFVLLATLAQGHALTQRELAGRMASDPSTVRAMLVLLEQRGLVQRETRQGDARARSVALTAAGKRKIRQLWAAGEPIREQMFSSLLPVEAQVLAGLLRRVADALIAQTTLADRSPSTPN